MSCLSSPCNNFPLQWPIGLPTMKKNPLSLSSPSTSSSSSSSSSSSPFTVNCRERIEDAAPLSTSSAYGVLGVKPNFSLADLKSAFRAKVKLFHPDIRKDGEISDIMIRRVIQAYELLSTYSKSEIIERECLDPFDDPECEAFDVFVNEVLCVGKGISLVHKFGSSYKAPGTPDHTTMPTIFSTKQRGVHIHV